MDSANSPTKRILFVDDEQAVLDGLANLLRKQRRQWQMTFALGGKVALEELEKAPFDIVVSDMRMPGMDGAELLRHVKERFPAVARVVLSGHADQEMVSRALPVAQQYLSKPCDAEQLRSVIERVCKLQALVAGTAVREIVGRLDKLPSIPETYWLLTKTIANPDAGIEDVAKVVQRDPAMCAKVLQLVNSAYFGLARPLTSVGQAISYLGLDLIKGLSLTLNVFGAASTTMPDAGLSFERLQRMAMMTAKLSKFIIGNPKETEAAYTAGLVHEIGTIILAMSMPDRLSDVVKKAAQSGRPVDQVEREELGAGHAEIGGYLLGVWGLPTPIVEAVACHRDLRVIARDRLDPAVALHVANALACQAVAEASGEREADRLDLETLQTLGLTEQLPAWRDRATAEARAVVSGSDK
ncbi:MAG TPA: response regulator [Kofleriaceae bacterium]|nr:response regulator [Kofleriaceae bacterium]